MIKTPDKTTPKLADSLGGATQCFVHFHFGHLNPCLRGDKLVSDFDIWISDFIL